ncbi:MAG: hypothetical protein PHY05_05590 [Methanothrix sp.]|nr:hypothetical protein [Methanothrix sp.]
MNEKDVRWNEYLRLGSPYRPAIPEVALIREYFQLVSDIYGMYLAITTSLEFLVVRIREQQVQNTTDNNTTIEELDKLFLSVELSNCNDPNRLCSRPIPTYMCSQGGFKEKNALGGFNQRMVGNMCLVLIYQYWDDHYRKKIAEYAKREKDDIKLDIMGDLRILRHSIVHNKGVLSDRKGFCKILKWYSAGDEISMDLGQFEELIHHVELGLSKLSQDIEDNVLGGV